MPKSRRTGKHVGRPALRRFDETDIDRMRELRSKGAVSETGEGFRYDVADGDKDLGSRKETQFRQ